MLFFWKITQITWNHVKHTWEKMVMHLFQSPPWSFYLARGGGGQVEGCCRAYVCLCTYKNTTQSGWGCCNPPSLPALCFMSHHAALRHRWFTANGCSTVLPWCNGAEIVSMVIQSCASALLCFGFWPSFLLRGGEFQVRFFGPCLPKVAGFFWQ